MSADPDDATRTPSALAEAEERFRGAMQAASIGMCLVAPDGSFLDVNPALCAMLGRDEQRLRATTWQELTHPDDLAGDEGLVGDVLAGRRDRYRLRKRYLRPDGTIVWGDLSVSCVRDGAGAVRHFVSQIVDVTAELAARAALEAALRRVEEARAELAEAQRVARIGSWRWEPVTDRVEWSDGMFPLYGLEPAPDAPSFAAQQARYAPGSRERLNAAVARTIETGAPYETPIDIVHPDGAVLHAIARGEVVPQADGSIRLRGTLADVSELVEAQSALRAGEQRFAAVFAAVHESIAVMRPVLGAEGLPVDHALEWVNAAWLRRFGFVGQNPVGRLLFELSPRLRAYLPMHRRVLATGTPERTDLDLGDGTWVDVQISRFDGRLLVVGRDITDRRAAERALAESRADLAEAQLVARVGSWRLDAATRAVTWSDGMYRLHGLAPTTSGAPHEAWRRFLDPADRAALDGRVRRLLADGTPYEHGYDAVLDDGSRRHFVARGTPVTDASGRVIGERGTLADVTELREAHERAARAKRADVVGQLAGGVAHDYNNLLAAISLNAELAASALPVGSPAREDVDEILVCARRAATLTQRLLAYGRRQALRPVDLDPAALVDDLAPTIHHLCGEAVAVTIRRPDASLGVRVDRAAIEQSLLHLVTNAQEAMPRGGRLQIAIDRVEVAEGDPALRPHAAPGAYVRVRVADSGTGIAEAALPRVFEPFFSTKDPASGAGLGLAAVEGAMAQSGGLVTVESELGRGSVFSLLLPEAPAAGARAGRAEASRPAPSSAGRRRVLVVDDAPVVRALLVRLLRAAGHDGVEADRPSVALARLEDDPGGYDVLVVDALLHETSGVELARHARALRPDLRIVFMSGYAAEDTFAGGAVPGGAAFLAKPFTGEALLAAIADPPAPDARPTD